MQSRKVTRKTSRGQFGWIYEVFCQEKSVKPLPAVQAYLKENSLHFCADRLGLNDWPPILHSIAENRSLSKISIYSRCRVKKIRENVNTEEKLAKLRRCGGKNRARPVLYTNFLLRCLVDSIAVFLRSSTTIVSITLDGIPLASKYLRILCVGLSSNRSLRNLSLTKCRIGDRGCDLLLGCLRSNTNLCTLNLSSCRLSNRSARALSLFLKTRRANLLQDVWNEDVVQFEGKKDSGCRGLQTLMLNNNCKFGDDGIRQLTYILKGDFWLKSLCLRGCGFTKRGGETIVELLQTNSVLTTMDISDNNIPCYISHIVSKILKRRQEKGERISLKKRLPNWKIINEHKKRKSCTIKSKRSRNRTKEDKKESFQYCRSNKDQKFNKKEIRIKRRKGRRICKTDFTGSINLHALESRLSNLLNRNSRLMKKLRQKRRSLKSEVQWRSRAEKECREMKPRLNNLKSKVITLVCLRSNVCGESTMIKGLQNVFENLEVFSIAGENAIKNMPDLEEKIIANKTKLYLPRRKQLQLNEINPLQRRPFCPPLKL